MGWNFALSDARALETLLSGAGFREVSVTRELRAIPFESREDYWATMEAGGGALGGHIRGSVDRRTDGWSKMR